MDENLRKFLDIVRTTRWIQPPLVWGETLRRAMSEDLISVGWGGVLKLTDAGRTYLDQQDKS